jgi:hypothetical protein
VAQLVSEATAFYTAHLTRVVSFLGDIFIKSPFFITKEEVSTRAPVRQERLSSKQCAAAG